MSWPSTQLDNETWRALDSQIETSKTDMITGNHQALPTVCSSMHGGIYFCQASSKAFPSGNAGIGECARVVISVPAEEDLPAVSLGVAPGVTPHDEAQSDCSDHGLRPTAEPARVLPIEGGRKLCLKALADSMNPR